MDKLCALFGVLAELAAFVILLCGGYVTYTPLELASAAAFAVAGFGVSVFGMWNYHRDIEC
jgi:hypothetical protein